mgnify:CR=1 FL=1
MDANSMHEGVALRAGEVLPGAAAHDEHQASAVLCDGIGRAIGAVLACFKTSIQYWLSVDPRRAGKAMIWDRNVTMYSDAEPAENLRWNAVASKRKCR